MQKTVYRLPSFIYGTAWKEERTAQLASFAIAAGFRAFDTANQRKHYFEAGLGEALQACYAKGQLTRDDFFLQTKFTYVRGQDHRLPYDPKASLTQQVEQSFRSSLEHLHTETVDSYVLHGPSHGSGMSPDDGEVWRAMESLYERRLTRFLGLSNVTLEQLKRFYESAKIKPTFVQNRCYAVTRWDFEVRRFCQEQGMHYQGFSLLTANGDALKAQPVRHLARKYSVSPQQIIFRFSQQIGMIPLTGTSRSEKMEEDLACIHFSLNPQELATVEAVGLSHSL